MINYFECLSTIAITTMILVIVGLIYAIIRIRKEQTQTQEVGK